MRLIFIAFHTSRGTQRTEYNELQRTALFLVIMQRVVVITQKKAVLGYFAVET
jgi:hypothetical protein